MTMTMTLPDEGTPIRLIAQHAGILLAPDDGGPVDYAHDGELATWVGPHETCDGFYLVAVRKDERDFIGVVFPTEFEVVNPEPIHQPRERSVPCSTCKLATWEFDGRCAVGDGCRS